MTPAEIGTRVLYLDRVHVVRAYNDLSRRTDLTDDDKALHYPGGLAYELWPEGVPFKFGERDKATYFVRRTSFTVLDDSPPEVCTCYYSCADDPDEECSLSGSWHVHPGDPCPVHPDAEGDA